MKKSCIPILLFCFLVKPSLSQEEKIPDKRNFPLTLSFFSHQASLPFQGMLSSPAHPGFSLGTEFSYKKGKTGNLFQTININYFHNKFNAKAFFLNSEFGYRHTLNFGLFGDAFLGVGYIHSYHPNEIFAQNSSGIYEKVKDKGKPAFLISGAIGLGYDFSRKTGWRISLFLKYQYALQTPHNLDSPMWPNSMLHIGLRILF